MFFLFYEKWAAKVNADVSEWYCFAYANGWKIAHFIIDWISVVSKAAKTRAYYLSHLITAVEQPVSLSENV